MKEKIINWLIKIIKVDTNKVSDGCHTFGELYEHRAELFIKICTCREDSWKTRVHFDGSVWNGWFLLGINEKPGEQLTYHLPEKYWKKLKGIKTIRRAPSYDGHTSDDVINRLRKL